VSSFLGSVSTGTLVSPTIGIADSNAFASLDNLVLAQAVPDTRCCWPGWRCWEAQHAGAAVEPVRAKPAGRPWLTSEDTTATGTPAAVPQVTAPGREWGP